MISDKLLSSVFGVECEFHKLESDYITFFSFRCDNEKCFCLGNAMKGHLLAYTINVHAFIHLAMCWVFDNGYKVDPELAFVYVYRFNGDMWRQVQKLDQNKYLDMSVVVEALEYVVNVVNDDSV